MCDISIKKIVRAVEPALRIVIYANLGKQPLHTKYMENFQVLARNFK